MRCRCAHLSTTAVPVPSLHGGVEWKCGWCPPPHAPPACAPLAPWNSALSAPSRADSQRGSDSIRDVTQSGTRPECTLRYFPLCLLTPLHMQDMHAPSLHVKGKWVASGVISVIELQLLLVECPG